MTIKNKTILITGSAKRLGRHLATHFALQGAKIAAHYHKSDKQAKSLSDELAKKGASFKLFKADLCQTAEIEKMVDAVLEEFKTIDVLINNASVFYETPFVKIDERMWDDMLDTNLKGPFFLTQQVAKKTKSKGLKIINIADSGGPKTRANFLPYWVSKAGMLSLTETLAKILMPHVQVNAIAPGPIGFKEDLDKFKNDITVEASDLAQAAQYIIESSSALTGNTIILDAGRRYV